MNMSPTASPSSPDLAGRLMLFPGASATQPALRSSRPDLVPALLRGRPASQAPALLGAVFTLCGQAHRWTAQRAIDAALAQPALATPQALQAHRLATVREHLLRISHDWPRLLPGAPVLADAASALRGCPVWQQDLSPAEQTAALPAWLATQWLGVLGPNFSTEPTAALQHWLAAYQADPQGWPLRWVAQTQTPLAQLLCSQLAHTQSLWAPGPTLGECLNPSTDLPRLALQLAQETGFSHRPEWMGKVPDTGPWARRRDPCLQAGGSVWQRLMARVVETVRLAATDGEHWLDHGALPLAAGEGLAWCEMARGLLLHWVRLDTSSSHPHARIAEWRVLAPTEWNFHPEGVLAQTLRRLPANEAASRDQAARLAVAFDPCVAFEVSPAEPVLPALEASPHA